mmetsp:Transcript_7080/g.12692  ORF Transcript_7080/g.12692 Transcript_7080/m.12692 type:complete len:426 (-) Transcript_7080:236-1513(-)|eukprot:CAMPEP_0201883910 /NCGR_PEP_ID=MMETSP0902-20130614/16300_1 /ASSEMBLY_ACC=CAM_ASM_000551 /TAXON_ID=420261 /ORGANISM="Thalassiosira antarctica, Strain CCMP982" /LENGTH=425 /DNA_ID=CAMNT_0048412777 /DNA_START=263 /DNA_END=1540 /DNA_ORIENTATION=+
MEGEPPVSEPATTQEEDSSRTDIGYQPRILPSMPYQDSDSPDSAPLPTPQIPAFERMPGYDVTTQATFPPTEPGGLIAGGIIQSSYPLGNPPYLPAAPGTGTYLEPWLLPSIANMPPVHTYPGYGSYQPMHGRDYSGQTYSHGMNAPMSYSPHADMGSQTGYVDPQVPAGSSYSGVGTGTTYGGGAQASPYYAIGYSQHQGYQAQAGYDHHITSWRGQGSWAIRPGRPFIRDNRHQRGPDGANLFIFHIPNEMNNGELLRLFIPYGDVVSARIETEEDTRRGKGYGYVSYADAQSAATAIQFLHGHKIQGKRLSVTYKRGRNERHGQERHPSPASFVPVQEEHARASQPHQHRRDRSPVGEGSVPVQEYAGPPERYRETTPTLPPIDTLDDGSESGDYQGAQRNTTSLSPLANLKDIEEALPDPK